MLWSLEPTVRVLTWKRFRNDISSMSLEHAVLETENLWRSAKPTSNYWLDYDDETSWPTPWELINSPKFCEVSKALGIIFTLQASAHGVNNTFVLAVAEKDSKLYHIVIISGKLHVGIIDGAITDKVSMDGMKVLCFKTIKNLIE